MLRSGYPCHQLRNGSFSRAFVATIALLTNTPLIVAELVVTLSQAAVLTSEGGATPSQGEETSNEGEREEHRWSWTCWGTYD